MFSGIITNLGRVESLLFDSQKDLLLKISTPKSQVQRELQIGCSIACDGICLTLIAKKFLAQKIIFSFQVSKETIAKTSLKNWQVGRLVNLEFALRMGDELGGHLVSGHVDGVAKVTAIDQIKDSQKFTFSAPKNLMKFIAKKGSIVLNGVSLTVNLVKNDSFSVNLINHTLENTNFKTIEVEDLVNLEIDLIARYLERFEVFSKGSNKI